MHRLLIGFQALLLLVLYAWVPTAGAAEPGTRRDAADVSLDAFAEDCQPDADRKFDHLEFVWVIPSTHWELSLIQEGFDAEEVAELAETLSDYVIVVAGQAKLNAFGVATFLEEQVVRSNLDVHASLRDDGRATPLRSVDEADLPTEMQQLLANAKPAIRSLLGQMGAGLVWIIYANDVEGRKLQADRPGRVGITLAYPGAAEANRYTVRFPADALFVPRRCPNGRNARVDWSFCPWTGKPLPPVQLPQ